MKLRFLTLCVFAFCSLHAAEPDAQDVKASAPAAKPGAAIRQASSKTPKAPPASAVLPPAISPWRLSAGGQWRTLGKAIFHNRSRAPSFVMPNFSGIANGDGSDGYYSDGYVLEDSTGSDTQTWNFGYSSASQVNGDTVTFHGTSYSTETNGRLHDSTSSQDTDGWGGFLKLESPDLVTWHSLTLSASIGYSYTRSDTDTSVLAYTAKETTFADGFTDTYTSLGGPLPPAHAGTFAGPGLVLSRIPVTADGKGDNGVVSTTQLQSVIRNRLSVNLHTLSFGPQITLKTKNPKLAMGGSLGVALNVADWDARTDETLSTSQGKTLATWHSEKSGTKVLPGGYLEANTSYQVTAKWSVTAFGRYDVSDSLHGNAGAASFSVKVTGWTVGVGATYRF